MTTAAKIAALVVAAGRGTRAGGGIAKQYARIGSEMVLTRTLRTLLAHPAIDLVQVVIHPDDAVAYASATASISDRLLEAVAGGATRQQSVLNGLEALSVHTPDLVLIHDAARPFLAADTITSVVGALTEHRAVIAAIGLADTVKRVDGTGRVLETVDRTALVRAQTPQGFHFGDILDAHRRAAATDRSDFTDDASLCEWTGIAVHAVAGTSDNTKLTTSEDVAAADRFWRQREAESAMEPRTGTGFDVHKLVAGDHVWLCGVRIPHTQALEGHSDADVGLHAITDALLGAIGDGDIGQHFPPSDPAWRGAASRLFAADAARRVRDKGGRIVNVDCTLLCEAPRIGPHRETMQQAVAAALGIPASRVGIKATTTETLGFTGRREGIAAMASALVLLPAGD